jgi:ABC-type amino acid transport substrate-binding protein
MLNSFLVMLALFAPASANDSVIQVGVSESPPFSSHEDGEWEGISISLWEKVAEDNGWEYEYVRTNLAGMLDGVSDDTLDIAVAALTITASREENMDFTTSYYTEPLGVATTRDVSQGSVWFDVITGLAAGLFWLFLSLIVMGSLYFRIERGKTLPDGFRGWVNACYWTLATMTTVGYGDEAPKSLVGRGVAMIWMVVSLFIFAWINGQFASAMTLSEMPLEVSSPSELRSYSVATVDRSVSAGFLTDNKVRYTTVPSASDLIDELMDPDTPTDFVVYDASLLRYYLSDTPGATVLDAEFGDQSYGFALPTGSELREPLNVGILTHINSDWWEDLVFDYTN